MLCILTQSIAMLSVIILTFMLSVIILIIMLSVAFLIVLLSVIIWSVIMLNVVDAFKKMAYLRNSFKNVFPDTVI
jgi:hypothetical protein